VLLKCRSARLYPCDHAAPSGEGALETPPAGVSDATAEISDDLLVISGGRRRVLLFTILLHGQRVRRGGEPSLSGILATVWPVTMPEASLQPSQSPSPLSDDCDRLPDLGGPQPVTKTRSS